VRNSNVPVILVAVAAVCGLIALITGAVGINQDSRGALTAFCVFLGLWMMATSGVLYYLLTKS
jgi:succinate-acetate transporter protein